MLIAGPGRREGSRATAGDDDNRASEDPTMTKTATTTSPPLPAPRAAFWAICLLGAWPIGWAAARLGLGVAVIEPVRDIAVLLLVSAAEEIVFRGGLQRALLHWRRLQRHGFAAVISAANAVTSILFAAAHLWNHRPLVALGVLPVSLLLGWVYERSRERLVPPVALHAYFNFALYGCTWWLSRGA